MPEPVHETATAVEYLDQLAASLEVGGYPCQTRYLEVPALLRVAHPVVAAVEELVAAVPGEVAGWAGQTWWYRWFSTGTPICGRRCGWSRGPWPPRWWSWRGTPGRAIDRVAVSRLPCQVGATG